MPAVLAPPIKVRTAPALEPPYDDDGGAPRNRSGSQQPVLPLDWSSRQAALLDSHLLVGSSRVGHRAVRRPLSPGRGAAIQWVQACVEVLNGYRPAAHMRRLATPADYPDIAAQIDRAIARVPPPPRPARTRPPSHPGQPSPPPVRLRELRVCEPRAGVAEAAAVLCHGGRVWALALRLERRPTGWLCTRAHVI